MKSKKILVAYFSHTGKNYGVGYIDKGNTNIIADMIAEQTGSSGSLHQRTCNGTCYECLSSRTAAWSRADYDL